jgi:hypothetical protein
MRWAKADFPNTANTSPWFPAPSAYDINLITDPDSLTAWIGPLFHRRPKPYYSYCNVTWKTPTKTVNNFDFQSQISNTFNQHGPKSVQIDYFPPQPTEYDATDPLAKPPKPVLTTIFNFQI